MNVTDRARAAGRLGHAVTSARADKHAAELARVVAEIRAAGTTTPGDIVKALSARGALASRGGRCWSRSQVVRMLARLDVAPAAQVTA
jgi:hypothetical protein